MDVLRDIASQTTNSHILMLALAETLGFFYSRFEVASGLETMALDDWNGEEGSVTIQVIERVTYAYLEQPEVQNQLDEVAERLVHSRQSRSSTRKWATFCGAEDGESNNPLPRE